MAVKEELVFVHLYQSIARRVGQEIALCRLWISEAEIVGVWGRQPPRLEIVCKSDTLSVGLDYFLVKFS